MANRNLLLLLCGLFLSALIQPSLQGGVYVPPGTGIGPGATGPGTGFFPGSTGQFPAAYKPAKAAAGGYGTGGRGVGPGGLVPGGVLTGGLGFGGLPAGHGGKAPQPGYGNLGAGGGVYGGYGAGGGGFYPGAGQKAAKRVPGTIGGPDGTGTGLPLNGRAPVIPQTGLPRGTAGKKAAKVPGAGIPGLVPGQGFSGRGVLPGVATGTDLNPKSIGAQQGNQGAGGPGFGGLMQPGVFHGYPLKSPKVQGGYGAKPGGGKLPFGYGGFGTGGAGLPGGIGGSGSRPGYPVGTGVGSGGISPGEPGKCGVGATGGLGGVGGIGGVGGVGATGGLGGGGLGGVGGVGGIGGGLYPGQVQGGFGAGSKAAKYGGVPGVLPGGAPIAVPGGGAQLPGGYYQAAKAAKYGVGGSGTIGGGVVPGGQGGAGGYNPAAAKAAKYAGLGGAGGLGQVGGLGGAGGLGGVGGLGGAGGLGGVGGLGGAGGLGGGGYPAAAAKAAKYGVVQGGGGGGGGIPGTQHLPGYGSLAAGAKPPKYAPQTGLGGGGLPGGGGQILPGGYGAYGGGAGSKPPKFAISPPVTGVSGGTGAGLGYGALGGGGAGAVPFVPGAGQYSPAAKAAKYGVIGGAGTRPGAGGGVVPGGGQYFPAAKAAKYGVSGGAGTALGAGGGGVPGGGQYSQAAKAAKYAIRGFPRPAVAKGVMGVRLSSLHGFCGPGVAGGVGTGLGTAGVLGVSGGGQYSSAAKAAKYGVTGAEGTGHVPGATGSVLGGQHILTPGTGYTDVSNGSVGSGGAPLKPGKDLSLTGTPRPGPTPLSALSKAPELPDPSVAGGIVQPSAGTSIVGVGVPVPSSVGINGQFDVGAKAPKHPPFLPVPGAGGHPISGPYAPYGGTSGIRPVTGVLPGGKPPKPPVLGAGAGIPLAAGGYQVGQGGAGGAKAPKPGYGNLGGGGVYQPGVAPGYMGGYPQQLYPGGYVPAPLTPQQAKAAKYGPLQSFLGGGGGGGGGGGVYRGGIARCQGKYCGRRK